jgi:predicted helicase
MDDEAAPRLLSSSRLNISPSFLRMFAKALSAEQDSDDRLPSGFTPEAVFAYLYSILNCPAYRTRYSEFLRTDFPRLPLASSSELIVKLAELGGELVALHLLESPKLSVSLSSYEGPKNPEVEKPTYGRKTVWLDKNQTYGFRGVPEAVWEFHVGGYQVCEKWLKDRRGRTLSKDDIAHYNKIVVALSETIRLMKRIDEVIDEHGGWPGAFATTKAQSTVIETD